MGQEAQCVVSHDGQVSEGKALLESDELLFRGEFRLRIPFADVRRVEASAGRLSVTTAGGTSVFELGERAARWADRIVNPKTLVDKLGVKPGARVSLLGVTDERFRALLLDRTGDVVEGELRPDSDLVIMQADGPDALERVGSLEASLKRDGGIWIVSPRGRAELTEADVLGAGRAAGLVDTKVARFSDTHTAHRFSIPKSRR